MSGCLSLFALFRRLNTLLFFWRLLLGDATVKLFYAFGEKKGLRDNSHHDSPHCHRVSDMSSVWIARFSLSHVMLPLLTHTHPLRWKLGNAACHAVLHATHSCINITMLSADAPTKILVPIHLHSRHRCLHARLFLRTYVLSFQQRPWNIYLHTLFKWKECTFGCSLQ